MYRTNRRTLLSLAASLALFAGTTCLSTEARAQAGTTFTYQGILKVAGAPVNSPTEMQFSLWNAPADGDQLGQTITQEVSVQSGLFTSYLDFGSVPFVADQSRYLQISVRNPVGFGNFVPMEGRQLITGVPYSLATRGVNVAADGKVGIGASAGPIEGGLSVTSTSSSFAPAEQGVHMGRTDAPYQASTGIEIVAGAGGNPNLDFRTNPSTDDFDARIIYYDFLDALSFEGADVYTDRNALVGGALGIGVWPQHAIDVRNNSTIGSSAIVGGDFNAPQNLGTKVRFGYTPSNACGNDFAGMAVEMTPGYLGGNSADLVFSTALTNVSCSREVMRIGGTGNVTIGTASPLLFTDLKLDVGGAIRCNTLIQTSAREFKQEIAPLTNALDSIMKLQGVTYSWNQNAPEDVQGHRDIGFIAEDMNAVLPDIVAKDPSGKPIGIDYGKVTPVTVEAIKQLKLENDQLKARLEKIEALLSAQSK